MKNRKVLSVIILVMAMLCLFSSCFGGGSVGMLAGSEKGSLYPVGRAVSGILTNENTGAGTVKVEKSTGAAQNIRDLAEGKADLALAYNDLAYYAQHGVGPFASDGVLTGFSAVAGLYTELCHIVAVPGSETIFDLAGRSISVGEAGSSAEIAARQMVALFGLSFNDFTILNLSPEASAEAFKKGEISGFFAFGHAPYELVGALAKECELTLLPITGEMLSMLVDQYRFYTLRSIPPGSYDGVDEEVPTIAIKVVIMASDSLEEDVVYGITKSIFEKTSDIQSPYGSEISPIFSSKSILNDFHPGAERYYYEVGALP